MELTCSVLRTSKTLYHAVLHTPSVVNRVPIQIVQVGGLTLDVRMELQNGTVKEVIRSVLLPDLPFLPAAAGLHLAIFVKVQIRSFCEMAIF